MSWVVASGEKDRSWLGRNPATTDPAPGLATTRPPLLATPGGVASRHLPVAAGRTNSCQKLLCSAADPPMTATAQVPVVVTSEVDRDGGCTGPDGPLD